MTMTIFQYTSYPILLLLLSSCHTISALTSTVVELEPLTSFGNPSFDCTPEAGLALQLIAEACVSSCDGIIDYSSAECIEGAPALDGSVSLLNRGDKVILRGGIFSGETADVEDCLKAALRSQECLTLVQADFGSVAQMEASEYTEEPAGVLAESPVETDAPTQPTDAPVQTPVDTEIPIEKESPGTQESPNQGSEDEENGGEEENGGSKQTTQVSANKASEPSKNKAIIGLAVAVVVLGVALAAAIWYYYCRKQRQKGNPLGDDAENDVESGLPKPSVEASKSRQQLPHEDTENSSQSSGSGAAKKKKQASQQPIEPNEAPPSSDPVEYTLHGTSDDAEVADSKKSTVDDNDTLTAGSYCSSFHASAPDEYDDNDSSASYYTETSSIDNDCDTLENETWHTDKHSVDDEEEEEDEESPQKSPPPVSEANMDESKQQRLVEWLHKSHLIAAAAQQASSVSDRER